MSDKLRKPQVDPAHYEENYDTLPRFASYWHQVDQVVRREPGRVLEIGIGNGFLHRYLRAHGIDVHTLDFDERLKPDTVGSVLDLPFEDRSFDVVVCFETLEHLPWTDFQPALFELRRVSKRWVLLSLPDVTPFVRLDLTMGSKEGLRVLKTLPNLRPDEHHFDGQHYWEIGKRGTPNKRICNVLRQSGLRLEEELRVFELPYHHYFACSVAE